MVWPFSHAMAVSSPTTSKVLILLALVAFSCMHTQKKDGNQSRLLTSIEKVTWYWLNSSRPNQWKKDFQRIKEIGIDRVVLWYGWNATWIARYPNHTQKALDLCKKVGLEAYLGIWSGTIMDPANSTKLKPYKMLDQKGNRSKGFNIFNTKWQDSWLKNYLRKIQKFYGNHPAMKGYYLDDTLVLEEGFQSVGYGFQMDVQFQNWAKQKYGRLEDLNKAWDESFKKWNQISAPQNQKVSLDTLDDWNEARRFWFQRWGRTVQEVLKVKERNQELIFSDFHTILDAKLPAYGIRWNDLIPFFSRIMVYNINISTPGLIASRIKLLRKETGDRLPVSWGIFTFVIGQAKAEKHLKPTSQELSRQIQEAKKSYVHAIDFYAFQVGDWSYPFSRIQNPLLGPPNPSALLRNRMDLQEVVSNQLD